MPNSRAISPVLGTVLLALITILLAGAVTASIGADSMPQSGPEFVTVSATATPDGTVTLTHESGDPIDVRSVDLLVRVDGTELEHQPPVPFFSATGFEPGPTGPFNSGGDATWSVGERTSFTVSESNTPALEAGDEVAVKIVAGDSTIAVAKTEVQPEQ